MGVARAAPVLIRRATATDQSTIKGLIRQAGINPMGLRWERFVLAEAAGQVIGTGQIKPHGDGSRELASLAVIPARQGEGIAGALIRALQRVAGPPLYLTCAGHLRDFYPRFGFRSLRRAEMPRDLRRIHLAANLILPILSPDTSLLVMCWDG